MMTMLHAISRYARPARITTVIGLLFLSMHNAGSAAAASPLGGAKNVAKAGGISTGGTLTGVVGGIISTLLGLVGVVFLVLTVYGGFLWMTAGGNEEKIGKAKKLLVSSVVGLVIVLAAYSISIFVVGAISGATNGTAAEPE